MVMVWAVLAVVLAIGLYWGFLAFHPPARGAQRPSAPVLALVGLGLALSVWSAYLNRPSYHYTRHGSPVAIAIAFDLSPSMLAIPDPSVYPGVKPRFKRGKAVLSTLFRVLEDGRKGVIVSMLGFTDKAGVIMGWDSNPSQIREMLDYSLSPDLFTSTGTNMEEAARALVRLFDTLPGDLKKSSRKIAILVSDGEDTSRRSSLGYARQVLREGSFDVVALQTGLLDTDEGVPVYGDVGEFLGFRAMGGRRYTVPDAGAMTELADAASGRGLYVRAEDPDAVKKILAFIGDRRAATGGELEKIGVVLGLFILVSLLYARLLI